MLSGVSRRIGFQSMRVGLKAGTTPLTEGLGDVGPDPSPIRPDTASNTDLAHVGFSVFFFFFLFHFLEVGVCL